VVRIAQSAEDARQASPKPARRVAQPGRTTGPDGTGVTLTAEDPWSGRSTFTYDVVVAPGMPFSVTLVPRPSRYPAPQILARRPPWAVSGDGHLHLYGPPQAVTVGYTPLDDVLLVRDGDTVRVLHNTSDERFARKALLSGHLTYYLNNCGGYTGPVDSDADYDGLIALVERYDADGNRAAANMVLQFADKRQLRACEIAAVTGALLSPPADHR